MADESVHESDPMAALGAISARGPGRPKGAKDKRKRKRRSDAAPAPTTYAPRPLNGLEERFCAFYAGGKGHLAAMQATVEGTRHADVREETLRRKGLRWLKRPAILQRIKEICDELAMPARTLAAKARQRLWEALNELEPGDPQLIGACKLALQTAGELGPSAGGGDGDTGMKLAIIINQIKSGEAAELSPAQLSQQIGVVLEQSGQVALPDAKS